MHLACAFPPIKFHIPSFKKSLGIFIRYSRRYKALHIISMDQKWPSFTGHQCDCHNKAEATPAIVPVFQDILVALVSRDFPRWIQSLTEHLIFQTNGFTKTDGSPKSNKTSSFVFVCVSQYQIYLLFRIGDLFIFSLPKIRTHWIALVSQYILC